MKIAASASGTLNVKKEEKKSNQKYEYYVHYVGLQRRNDRWLSEDFVKQDDEECKRRMAEIERK